ncbi:2-amino-4-hydroxy-6-hydroxymethyldihydropteridine diphosphokinase [Paenibacillus daejeonensis]|uniref:2-amino-4-hydroxy-6- hydroxymethyldihydropteridine diphosphokinase n=1 Tax=Paenibacillus daejeonensis TaxID=135193 RepID=UPI00036523DB|nr:2-amino-4-hydroxy-6-hydroxymethyldihydropteridine diphosphokinase [Paenibacillus daejeonensis]
MKDNQLSRVAYIALGSNLGDRERLLRQALGALDAHEQIAVLKPSAIYETEPVGYTDQPAFLNMAAMLETTLSPTELLQVMLEIERQLGRVREERWGPRTIDLDLLHYEGTAMHTELLILPHPRMMERAFVLVPLSEVLAEGPLQEAVLDTLGQLGKEGMTRWNTSNWPDGSEPSAN